MDVRWIYVPATVPGIINNKLSTEAIITVANRDKLTVILLNSLQTLIAWLVWIVWTRASGWL